MATYIDLNPVRAGIVDDPKDYRWCSLGAASAGNSPARSGIKQIVDTLFAYQNRQPVSLARAVPEYRLQLVVRGKEEGIDPSGQPLRRGFSKEVAQQTLENKGELSLPDALRCRVRYFTDGAVIGSKESIEHVFQVERWRFGPKRSSGARKFRRITGTSLCSLRDLRLDVIE